MKKLYGFKVSFATCSTTLIAKHVTKYYFGKTENTNEAKVNQERILLSLYYFDYLTLYLNRQIIWHTVLGMRKTHLLPHEKLTFFYNLANISHSFPNFVTNFLSEIWNLTSYFDDAVQRRKHKMETMKDDEVKQTTKLGIKQIDSQSEI